MNLKLNRSRNFTGRHKLANGTAVTVWCYCGY